MNLDGNSVLESSYSQENQIYHLCLIIANVDLVECRAATFFSH